MLDFILLFVVVLFILFGVLRGFIKEILSIAGIIFSIIIAVDNHDIIIRTFEIESNLLVFNVISTICVFVISMAVVILLQSWIVCVLRPIRLGFIDRFSGFFIGIFKGFFVSYIIIFLINVFYYSIYAEPGDKLYTSSSENKWRHVYKSKLLPRWVKNSASYSFFIVLDPYINSLIPKDFNDQLVELGASITRSPDKEALGTVKMKED